MRTFALIGVALWTAVASAQGTQDSAPPPARPVEPAQAPTFRPGVDLVCIDVGVVDGRGRPVEDLRATDFVVRIDGEPRRVVAEGLAFDDSSRLDPIVTLAGAARTSINIMLVLVGDTPASGRGIRASVEPFVPADDPR